MDEAWERAVEVACDGEEPQAVRSLTLDGAVKCSQGRLPAPALLERFTQLRVLSIANVGLTSLADFPSLKHLERLILSDNRISGGLEHLVNAELQSLRDLDLSNNKIQQFDELAPLAQLNLLSLDLYECPITRLPEYRPKVFSLIKSLQYLDKVDAEDNERPESDDEEDEHDDEHEDDGEDDGVDDEEPGYAGDTIFSSNGQADDDEDDENEDGEESDELDEDDEENLGNNQRQRNEESGSDEEEVDDDDDTEQVLEVQESEEEGAEDEEEEDDDDDDDDDEDGTENPSAGVDGEIEAQGEDDEDNSELGDDDEGDEGVDDVEDEDDESEEEDLGTAYLVQPIAQPEDEEAASDFEPGEDDYIEDDDEIDEDDEDEHVAGPAAAADLKRKRDKDVDDEIKKEERPPKK